MKILFFVDTHGSETRLRRILDKASGVDLVVCSGDFTMFETGMARILREMNNIGKPVIIIHGNHEVASTVMHECMNLKNLHFIHKSAYVTDKLIFFGYGGGGFGTRDESFVKVMHKLLAENSGALKTRRLVLVTHAPPFGTRLDDLGKSYGHVGNQSMSDFIIQAKPLLVACGHIHECAGQEDKMGDTILINPGWDGMVREL